MIGMAKEATFFDVLQQHGRRLAGKVAVQHVGGSALTYDQLAGMAAHLRHRFEMLPGEVRYLPLCLSRSGTCIAAMVAAMGAGRGFICLNQKLPPLQIADILRAAKAPVAMLDAGGMLMLRGWAERSGVEAVDWWVLPGGRWTSLHDQIAEGLSVTCRMDAWSSELGPSAHCVADETESTGESIACCLFTSGSTGVQKGVRISAVDLMARVEAEAKVFGICPEDVLLNVLPFSFDVGLNQVLSAVLRGATLVISESWLPADMMKTVADWKVTGISAVPSIWTSFVRGGFEFDVGDNHQSLRYVTVSGGDMSVDDLARLRAATRGIGIYKTYGQTEAFRSSCLCPEDFDRKSASVGRPFSDCKVYVIDEKGRRLGAGEEGQIVHTGLGTMVGYLEGDTPTDKLRTNPYYGEGDPHRMAVFTGDQGRLDEEGFLYILGRRDQMAKIHGNRVYPKGITDAITDIDGVAGAEVLAVLGGDGLDHLVAFVVPGQDRMFSASDIERELSRRLPSFMVPEHFHFRSAMPLTTSGKLDRVQLLDQGRRVVEAPGPNKAGGSG